MAANRTILAVKGLEANTSNRFRYAVLQMADRLAMNADYLAAVMAFETGGTFDPAIENYAGSGAVGLIQFTKMRAELAGTTREALKRMSAVQQLEYVERALATLKGRVHTLSDHYMAVFAPGKGIGVPGNTALYSAPSKSYELNAALDANGDGTITVAEATGPVASIVAAAEQRPRILVTEPAAPPPEQPQPRPLPPLASHTGSIAGVALAIAFILGIRRFKRDARR
jgi:hypothetical protein